MECPRGVASFPEKGGGDRPFSFFRLTKGRKNGLIVGRISKRGKADEKNVSH